MKLLYVPLLLFFFILTSVTKANNQVAEYTNVGLSDLTLELKTKFPMCEKVLNVTWINKGKKIGYADYDIYWADGTYIDKFKAFVDLGSPENRFTYKIVAYYPKKLGDGKENLIPDRARNHKKYSYFVDKVRLVGDNFDSLLAVVKKFNSVDDFLVRNQTTWLVNFQKI